MRDVFGMSCDPRPARTPATPGRFHRFAYVAPTLAATVFTALILHLLVELGSRFDAGDPVGMLSVLLGMAAVLVTLMPFAVLYALRARRAWRADLEPRRSGAGPRAVAG